MGEKDLKRISRTNWTAFDADSDGSIDYSDIPPLTDSFFENATLRVPLTKTQKQELDRRAEAYDKDPENVLTWKEVKSFIQG